MQPVSIPPLVVVMGATGAGKSTVGAGVAAALGVGFVDGDALHPEANVAKMTAGIPLDDDDRWPWHARVGGALAAASNTGLVVACSALKRSYRDAIRAQAPGAVFIQLDGSREVLMRHLGGRVGHFMPVGLLDSQLAILEPLAPDEHGTMVSVDAPIAEVIDDATAFVLLD